MRQVLFYLLLFLLPIVQSSLLMPFSLWGIRPDLTLLFVVTVSLVKGPTKGGVAGLFGGLFVDVLGGNMIGLGGMVKAVIGMTVGVVGTRMFWENAFVPIGLVFAASIADRSLYFIGAKIFGVDLYVMTGVFRILGPSAWYDALAAVLVYPLFARLIRAISDDPADGMESASEG